MSSQPPVASHDDSQSELSFFGDAEPESDATIEPAAAESGDPRPAGTGSTRTRHRPRRRSRWLTLVGVLLILSGAGMLGYVGWQFYGTTWLSHRKQAALIEKLETQWDEPVTGGGDSVASAGSTADAIIRIPRFGADYAIPVLEGVEDEALESGYGHFSDSARAGATGNYALAAHRITHGEPLRRMPDLQVGDKIVVETRRFVYTYRLTSGGDDLEVTFNDGWVVSSLPKNPQPGGVEPAQEPGQRLITLTTCAELFHTDMRMIAFGVLEGKEKKPTA